MLPVVVVAIAVAPLYWLLVPATARRTVALAGSVAVLAVWDVRLVAVVAAVTAMLFLLVRSVPGGGARGRILLGAGLAALAALFVWNKLAGGRSDGVLPSQGGLVLLGVSYLVLKAAAALLDAGRGELAPVRARDLATWLAFLPTYPAGPMADLERFTGQHPTFDRARVLAGLERILFGLVKSLVLAHALGTWADPLVADPGSVGRGTLLLGLYALSLRFYLDFAGYSDVAIGLAAVYGFDIEENFDWPFVRRNLASLWQHWHMTLTRWLRLYLFLPITRTALRRGGRLGDRFGPAVGQLVTMTFCGLWHGLTGGFALWGALQAVGLIWVGSTARALGAYLPPPLVQWWRTSPVAYACSTAVTVTYFSATIVFVVTDVGSGLRYLGRIVGAV
jgi:D-alanyl-lipoteichoic acid acyltransferase DltB (MBOAT superfamily)